MKKLVIWYNQNTQKYYYKMVISSYKKYQIGDVNGYGHEIVLIIDLYKEIINKIPIRKKILRKLIRILRKWEQHI